MFGLGVMAAAGYLTYASFPVECPATPVPPIEVSYSTADVQYDFSKSADELTHVKSDTISPYPPGTRATTEGLRADRPRIEWHVGEETVTYPMQRLFCINYKNVDIHVSLKPVIFIADQWPPGACRDAILEHERKHVRVDHEVMDEFLPHLKDKVRDAVAHIGGLGPLDQSQQGKAQDLMEHAVDTAVHGEIAYLHQLLTERQSHVDTLREYQRVSAICDRERPDERERE